jgi:hypothetical protein
MGRKTETIKVPSEWGARDAGKIFRITEMSAAQAEKWAMRALMLLRGSGERIPANIEGFGMIGVAILGFNVFMNAQIKPDELEPLLDEMMTCVQIVRDPKNLEVATDIVSADDIEEVRTRLWLRSEILRLHTNFSPADALSTFLSAIQAASASISENT